MSYKEKFLEEWGKAPFITQKIAGKIIGITTSRVGTLVKNGKIGAYKEDGEKRPMPYLKDVLEYKPKENMKRTKKCSK